MFQGLQLDNTILEEAQKQAEINWRWWQDDFEHNKAFGKMPVFNDYPRFLGFGADYSVFRGLDTKQLEKLQIWFRNEQYPDSFGTLFRKFSNFANDESLHKKSRNDNWPNRISLISKLLCLWRPEEYAMWDTLARAGLKKLHNSTRAHCYSQTNENKGLTQITQKRGYHGPHAKKPTQPL